VANAGCSKESLREDWSISMSKDICKTAVSDSPDDNDPCTCKADWGCTTKTRSPKCIANETSPILSINEGCLTKFISVLANGVHRDDYPFYHSNYIYDPEIANEL
jgi:hypothetical protein